MCSWRFNPRSRQGDSEEDIRSPRREPEPGDRTGRSDGRQGSRRVYAGPNTDDMNFLNYNSPLRQTIITPPSRKKGYEHSPDDNGNKRPDYSMSDLRNPTPSYLDKLPRDDNGAKKREKYSMSELRHPTPSYLDQKRDLMSRRNIPPEYSSLGRLSQNYKDRKYSEDDAHDKKRNADKKDAVPLDDINAVMARYSSAKESNITEDNGGRSTNAGPKSRLADHKKYAFDDNPRTHQRPSDHRRFHSFDNDEEARKRLSEHRPYSFDSDEEPGKRPADHRRYHSFDNDDNTGYRRRGFTHEHGSNSPSWRSFEDEPEFGVGAHGSVDSPRTRPRQRRYSGGEETNQPQPRPWRDDLYGADSGPSSLPLYPDRYGTSGETPSSPLNVNRKTKPSPIAVAIARRIDNEANRANATSKNLRPTNSGRPMPQTDFPGDYVRCDSVPVRPEEAMDIPPPAYESLRDEAVPVVPRPETACANLEYMRPDSARASYEYTRPESAQSYCYKLPSGEVISISSPSPVDLSKGIPPPPSYHRRTLDGIPISCASSLSDYSSLRSDRGSSSGTPVSTAPGTPQEPRSVSSFSDYGSGVSSPQYGEDPFGSNASTPTPGATPLSRFRKDSYEKGSCSPTPPVTPRTLSREDSYKSGSSTPTLASTGKQEEAPNRTPVKSKLESSPSDDVDSGRSNLQDDRRDHGSSDSIIDWDIGLRDFGDKSIPPAQRYTGRIGPGVPVILPKPRRRIPDDDDEDSGDESPGCCSPRGGQCCDEESDPRGATGSQSDDNGPEEDPTRQRLMDILSTLGVGEGHEGLKEFLGNPVFGKKRWLFDKDDGWGAFGRHDHRRRSESDDEDSNGNGSNEREADQQSRKSDETGETTTQRPKMSRSQSEATSNSETERPEGGRRRSLFDDFRLKFDSFGSFKDANKKGDKHKKDTLRFRDFDDLVAKAYELKEKLQQPKDKQAGDEKKTNTKDAEESPDEEKSKTTHVCGKDCQYTCHHKCRQAVTLDCASVSQDGKNAERPSRSRKETSFKGTGQADDTDSGYHTGDSTLRGHGAEKSGPGDRTLTREELRQKIDAFNDNQHGLLMTLEEDTVTFQGFIRVYMNLMRPISMSLPARPPSLYDVLTHDGEPPEPEDTLTTSFYLPKDTTKVIHITSETTAQEVIKALLHKFKITDNPRKFALYEKIEENGKKPCMRRLVDCEKPLPLCLSWTADGLNEHKFVLQENDTGEIMWDAFSLPELENFLCILDREEEEYVDQIKAKFHLLQIQMQKRLKELVKTEKKDSAQVTLNGHLAQHADSNSHVPGSSSPSAISPNPEETTFLGDQREPVFV